MRITEVSKILLEGIDPSFRQHSFALNKQNREFKRHSKDK